MDYEEVVKVPLLFGHYNQHLIEQPGIGFLEFINEHYNPFGKHEGKNHEHSSLPMFEHCCHCVIAMPHFFNFRVISNFVSKALFSTIQNSNREFMFGCYNPYKEIKPPKFGLQGALSA
jgi:hypothetical protein